MSISTTAEGNAEESTVVPVQERVPGWELLRVLAVLGVVWFHGGAWGGGFAYAGLPSLLVLSCVLVALRSGTGSMSAFTMRRFKRLLVPWLFWSAVYGCFVMARWLRHSDGPSPFAWHMLLTGTSLHLWYLPFAFGAALIVAWVARLTESFPAWLLASGGLAAGFVLVVVSASLLNASELRLEVPLPQWIFGMPALAFGLAIAALGRLDGWHRIWLLPLGLCAVAGCIGLGSLPYAIAISAVCVGALWRNGLPMFIQSLAELSFGVYLLHPLVALTAGSMTRELGGWEGRAAVTIVASFGVTWLLVRTPVARFL